MLDSTKYGFIKLGGIDYSKSQVHIAQEAMPSAHITQGEAKHIDSVPYDCVCSFSVFHYFPSLEYAQEVIEKMIAKARKKILFLDILDSATKAKDIAYKKQLLGESYEAMYGSLPHLYYEKEMFLSLAKKHNCKAWHIQQNIPNYENSAFRFNIIMEKA